MRSTASIVSVVALSSLLCTPAALAAKESKCSLMRYAELPVTMVGTRPLVSATINGLNAQLLIDSGATRSLLTRQAAEKFQLKLRQRIEIRGVDGSDDARLGYAKDFSLAGFFNGKVFHDVQFTVYGDSGRYGPRADGLIGQNVFGQGDVEFDLGNGMVRLYNEKDCGAQSLAYWSGNAAVAVMDVSRLSSGPRHIVGEATLNGKKIQVIFDSGASRSVLTLRAAARAGIKPDQDNVVAAGIGRGIGVGGHETSLARFEVLDLGGEQIKNALIRIGDIAISNLGDMLLGADFFLSHRIYVSSRQNKVYFTYNGGRVFELGVPDRPQDRPKQNAAVAATDAATETPPEDSPENSPENSPEEATAAADVANAQAASDPPAFKDADGFRRRGAASAGRMEFASAIADFDRAIQLDPNDAETYYQRGLAKLQSRQGGQALGDFDQALKLKPDHIQALVERGTFRLARRDAVAARTDFDTAIELASQDGSLPLRIAQIYARYRQFDAALQLLDQWIDKNRNDDRLAAALDGRCRIRMTKGEELDLALADCNAALKKGGRTSELFNSRALVYMRRGDFDKAIADFRASLKLQPKNAATLYGLGVAELKQGAKADGDRNIQAAVAIAPNIAQFYARLNLAP